MCLFVHILNSYAIRTQPLTPHVPLNNIYMYKCKMQIIESKLQSNEAQHKANVHLDDLLVASDIDDPRYDTSLLVSQKCTGTCQVGSRLMDLFL